jgi:hypothetical protein
MIHFKLIEKQKQNKPKSSRWREIINIKAEINELQIKQTKQRISEMKSWFFEKINKINKPLANITKWGREKT